MSAAWKPNVSKTKVIELAAYYGVKSFMINKIEEYPSYDDQVFYVEVKPKYHSKDGICSFIIKCSILASRQRVDLWIKLSQHLIAHNIPTPKPLICTASDHPYIYVFNQENKTIKVHCTQYVYGILGSNVEHTPIFLQSLGAMIGNIHSVLTKYPFDHRESEWENEWCPAMTDKAIRQISNISQIFDDDESKLQMIEYYLKNFEIYIKPKVNSMEKIMLLGDINDSNIICNKDNHVQIISVFDFGESHKSLKVFDLAICCSYFMMGKALKDAINSMLHIIKGYHRRMRLKNDEIEMIFVAICSRILVSAVLGFRNYKSNPKNEWLLHHAKPAWLMLQKLYTIKPNEMTRRIKRVLFNSGL